jgi:hypothetical protein
MANKVHSLLSNVVNALLFSPPNYLRSLIGNSTSWHRSSNADTELQLLERQHFPANLHTARAILFPALPGKPRWLAGLASSTGIYRQSAAGLYPVSSEPAERYANESWLLLNGMCADKAIAELNADYVYRLFGRQLTLLHNETHGFALDLAECAVGKGWLAATEAVQQLFPAFYSELKRPDIDRVVLIAHSQGTILAAVFLAMLQQLLTSPTAAEHKPDSKPDRSSPEARYASAMLKSSLTQLNKTSSRIMQQAAGPAGCLLTHLEAATANSKQALLESVHYWLDWSEDTALGLPALTRAELKKLEIYSFATCATDMQQQQHAGKASPYIEHFGNSHDLVARLGLFAPQQGPGSTRIDGLRFIHQGGWGHLLNAHYLQPLQQQWQKAGELSFEPLPEQTASRSRLEDYYRQAHPTAMQRKQARTATS